MGGMAKTVKKVVSNPGRLLSDVSTFGKYEGLRKLPGPAGELVRTPENTINGIFGRTPQIGGGSSDFYLDPEQMAADQNSLDALMKTDSEARAASRSKLSDALIKQNQEVFRQGMAGTLEDLNSRGLANSSGVGQEFARQQGDISSNISNQIATLGAGDIENESALRQAGLSRKFSMEDFINQANVAKSIGAQTAPQVPSGKGSALSTTAGALGAAAPFISLFNPAAGVAAGAASAATQRAFPAPVASAGGRAVYPDQVKRGK